MPTCGNDPFLDFSQGPITTFSPGQRVQFEVRVTAHHMGHFQFRLCDRAINSSLGGYAGEEACLRKCIRIVSRTTCEAIASLSMRPTLATGICHRRRLGTPWIPSCRRNHRSILHLPRRRRTTPLPLPRTSSTTASPRGSLARSARCSGGG